MTPAVTAGKAKNAGIFNGTLSLISTPSNTQVGTETVTYQVNNFAAQTANYTGVGSFNGGGGGTQSLTYGNLRVTATGGLSSTALAIRNTGGLTTAAAFTDQLNGTIASNTLVGGAGFTFTGLANFSGILTNTTNQLPTAAPGTFLNGYMIGITPNPSTTPSTQTIVYNLTGSNPSFAATALKTNPTLTLTISAGQVFTLAVPQFSGTSIGLAARAGDAAPSGSVTLTNVTPGANPDVLRGQTGNSGNMLGTLTGSGSAAFTVTGPPIFAPGTGITTASGAVPSGTFTAKASTANAGSFAASQALTISSTDSLFASLGENQLTVSPLSLTANIYTPATATVTSSVNFASSMSAIPRRRRRSRSGNLGAGLTAGSTDKSSIIAGLSTKNAGIFSGSATLSLTSHDSAVGGCAGHHHADRTRGTGQQLRPERLPQDRRRRNPHPDGIGLQAGLRHADPRVLTAGNRRPCRGQPGRCPGRRPVRHLYPHGQRLHAHRLQPVHFAGGRRSA